MPPLEENLDLLLRRLHGLASRRPGFAVTLFGEAGIGKSFTARALLPRVSCATFSGHATQSLSSVLLALPRPKKCPVSLERTLERLRGRQSGRVLGQQYPRPGLLRTLRRHVETLEHSTAARQAAGSAADKLRRYKEFHDGAASWSRVERIIARVEASAQGTDTRFVVTNLTGSTARTLYEDLYCRRGQAENHIKSWKTHLAADRTSCHRGPANQLRLMLHTGAYWLMWSLRRLMPKHSSWRVAQFDTLRLRLLKLAARVVEWKTKVMVHLPSAFPDQVILRLALERMPRLVI